MGKKNQTSNYDESNPPPFEEMPDGFKSVTARRDAAWWKPITGQSVQGILVGRFSRTGEDERKRYYYQLILTKPCRASVYDANEQEWNNGFVQRGGYVNIDERMDLQGLSDLCDNDKINEIWVKALSKTVSKKNRAHSFWRFQVGARVLSELPSDLVDTDVPFEDSDAPL